MISSKNRIL